MRKMKKMKFNDDERDLLSDLPTPLLHEILSYLDMKDVMKTSLLSRRWRSLWASLPFLSFNVSKYPMKFVNDVLLHHDNCKIERLSLSCNGMDFSRYFPLILAATKHNLDELHLEIIGNYTAFQLPDCLFACKKLRKLKFTNGSSKPLSFAIPSSICLPMLKTLILKGINVKGDWLNDSFFSSCPNLESLSIRKSKLHKTNISISSHSLKHLELDSRRDYSSIDGIGSLRLNTPNLESFRCIDYISKEYRLGKLPALVTAEIDLKIEVSKVEVWNKLLGDLRILHGAGMRDFLIAIRRVKELKLSASILEVISADPALLDRKSIKFSNLRSLKLEVFLSLGCSIATSQFLKIAPKLETLLLKVTKNSLHVFAKRQIDSGSGLGSGSDPDPGSDAYSDSSDEDSVTESQPYLDSDLELGLDSESACERKHSKFLDIRKALGCISQVDLLTNFLQNKELANKAIFFTSTKNTGIGGIFGFSERILTYQTASAQWDSCLSKSC